VAVVDTREKHPFGFSRFEGWFADVQRRALDLGNYSVAGLEHLCVVERKDLPTSSIPLPASALRS